MLGFGHGCCRYVKACVKGCRLDVGARCVSYVFADCVYARPFGKESTAFPSPSGACPRRGGRQYGIWTSGIGVSKYSNAFGGNSQKTIDQLANNASRLPRVKCLREFFSVVGLLLFVNYAVTRVPLAFLENMLSFLRTTARDALNSYKEFKRTRSQSAPDDDLAADRRLSHILRSAVAGEVKNSYQLCDELEMIQACDEAFKVFSVVHLVKGRKSVSEWTADFSQALVELMSTATPGPRQNNAQNKPATQLTLDAQMIHQRFATRVFKATLMRCLKQGLPQNKEDYFEVVYAGVNLMQIVATKFHHHYLSSGALVLSEFAEQWKKGIVDIEALWPRGKKFRDH